ncbi:MAG: hypothetical protein IJ287_03180 [Methanobrevibacter sp.]|nr:hypothetical protein [Methanobrevibacter sp.]MBR1748882.1 hypothetical protein [Bacilli bacterium]
MTENKRFTLLDGIKKGTHSGIWDNQKQHNQGIGDELWLGEVVGMLNEGVILAEENKELKELITDKNKTQTETLKQLTRTQKELQTIKNTIKDMYNTERTHIGHNVLAQLIETIQ